MNPEESVTQWIDALRAGGDDAAARHLWNRYFQLLVTRLQSRIANRFRRVSDEEDVALSAIDTLIRGIREDRYPDLNDRESLWSLLLTLADRRATRHFRRESSRKRGGGAVWNLPPTAETAEGQKHPTLEQIADSGPTPEFTAALTDELAHLLDRLEDPLLREMAVLELEGYTPAEIQQKLDLRSERTYFRKKKLLRTLWQEALEQEDE